MTPLKHIRTKVFNLNQMDLAERLSVTQSYISKAERKAVIPAPLQMKIRAEAAASGVEWSDSFFFEVP